MIARATTINQLQHSESTDRPRRFLPLGDFRGVRAVLEAFLKVRAGVLERLRILQQINGAEGQHLGGDEQPLVPDGRADGGDVLPAVPRTAGRETGRVQSRSRYVPA